VLAVEAISVASTTTGSSGGVRKWPQWPWPWKIYVVSCLSLENDDG